VDLEPRHAPGRTRSDAHGVDETSRDDVADQDEEAGREGDEEVHAPRDELRGGREKLRADLSRTGALGGDRRVEFTGRTAVGYERVASDASSALSRAASSSASATAARA